MWSLRHARDGWAVESGQYQRATRGYTGQARLPPWYQQRPPEFRGEDFYLRAFTRLVTTRAVLERGFGPIPWTAAADYASRHGLSPIMQDVFCDVLALLDDAYRDHLREQNAEAVKEAQRQAAAGAQKPAR